MKKLLTTKLRIVKICVRSIRFTDIIIFSFVFVQFKRLVVLYGADGCRKIQLLWKICQMRTYFPSTHNYYLHNSVNFEFIKQHTRMFFFILRPFNPQLFSSVVNLKSFESKCIEMFSSLKICV